MVTVDKSPYRKLRRRVYLFGGTCIMATELTAPVRSDKSFTAKSPCRDAEFWSRNILPVQLLLTACSMLVVLCFINRNLFRLRIVETGDLATILFQVRDAEHFKELLGNYSRFQFHHPGPAFMYLLALGDGIFRDALHLCPAPTNSAFLTMLVVNVLLLVTSIGMFARHCRSKLFVPSATLGSILLMYLINRTNTPVTPCDVWLPHMLLFVFLLFFTLCAAAGTGSVKSLPGAVLCGGMLAHGHAAQILFVTVLLFCSLVGLYATQIHPAGIKTFTSANWRPLLASIVLLGLLTSPIVADRLLNHPNNIHKIRSYLAEHRGERNSLALASKYELTFLTFTYNPDALGASTAWQLIFPSDKKPYVLLYWIVLGGLTCIALLAVARQRAAAQSVFLPYVAIQAFVVGLLFLYWAIRIIGPLYTFNGFFFYSMQFAVIFLLTALILNASRIRVGSGTSAVLACLVPFVLLASPTAFRRIGTERAEHSSPEVQLLASEVETISSHTPRQATQLRVRFQNEGMNWAVAMGVASRLHWADQPLCVDERSATWLEDAYVCRHVDNLSNLVLESPPGACQGSCRFILSDQLWSARLEPFPAEKLPFMINLSGDNSLNLNFYDPEDGMKPSAWSKNSSAMRFLLSSNWSDAAQVQVRVTCTAVQGRTVNLLLNGNRLGEIAGSGPLSETFVVPSRLFLTGAENELAFKTNDDVGVLVQSVEFDPFIVP